MSVPETLTLIIYGNKHNEKSKQILQKFISVSQKQEKTKQYQGNYYFKNILN